MLSLGNEAPIGKAEGLSDRVVSLVDVRVEHV